MAKKRIFIIVKTYPTISKQYAELVCTAGILEDGTWIRIYPMPFRLLEDNQKFPKYSWVEIDIEKRQNDFRPESYSPKNYDINIEKELKTGKRAPWKSRKDIIFKNKKIFTNMSELIDKAYSDEPTSLAVFKPARLIDFFWEEDERNWDEAKLAALKSESQQLRLFQTKEELDKEFDLVKKIPYKFFYKFEDDNGKPSNMRILDWEIGMLYLNCLKQAGYNENIALTKVKEKYWGKFISCDLHFFLGTTFENHQKQAKNPFTIIGVFYPPINSSPEQKSLPFC